MNHCTCKSSPHYSCFRLSAFRDAFHHRRAVLECCSHKAGGEAGLNDTFKMYSLSPCAFSFSVCQHQYLPASRNAFFIMWQSFLAAPEQGWFLKAAQFA